MKLDKSGDDAFFLSNGFYRFNDTWKNRGIGYDSVKDIDIEHIDTKSVRRPIVHCIKTLKILESKWNNV